MCFSPAQWFCFDANHQHSLKCLICKIIVTDLYIRTNIAYAVLVLFCFHPHGQASGFNLYTRSMTFQMWTQTGKQNKLRWPGKGRTLFLSSRDSWVIGLIPFHFFLLFSLRQFWRGDKRQGRVPLWVVCLPVPVWGGLLIDFLFGKEGTSLPTSDLPLCRLAKDGGDAGLRKGWQKPETMQHGQTEQLEL